MEVARIDSANRKFVWRAWCVLQPFLLVLCGCASDPRLDRQPLSELPETMGVDGKLIRWEQRQAWFSFFRNEELKALARKALRGNPSLAAARERLEQARARADQAGSAFWPTVEASIEASRQKAPLRAGVSNAGQGIEEIDTYRASLAASYEVDLWSRLSSQEQAARLAEESAAESARAVSMTLVANVTEAWLDVKLARQRIALLKQQLALSKDQLALAEKRLSNGMGSALNVSLQDQQVAAVQERLERAEAQGVAALAQLSILVGEPPQKNAVTVEDAAFPSLPSVPEAGLPSEFVYRRPDLAAALAGFQAEERRLASALAERFPALRLRGSLFGESMEWEDLFDDLFWRVAASLSEEIFDGGRERASVALQRSVARERYADFHSALLSAFGEVATTAAQYEAQLAALQWVERQVESAQEAARLAEIAFSGGEVPYIQVLDTERTLHQAQLGLLTAKRQLLALHVQLCRALGGAWPESMDPLESDREEGGNA
ncbi:efflux transporter outer membrane subunit [Pelagicoccus sp. SDUM812003]|uniref:efflux transporter outer membrane subunit n=1 Tax=Pelagicoccus sp. SDUM812003 TaxID=3041267 RepID=UPI00280F4AE7|nr:efflux transporter outer membrane subunit [Pelagicoccus sp. SDUM812003]MDQ8204009.1 efflux transporter outer membrane subunit [Pelagicoccus sp. SDUM812003]